MDTREWLPHAQALKEGTTRKIGHSCGPGDCLQINHKRDGWSAYCHRCGPVGFVRRPAESLQEKLARIARIKDIEDGASFSLTLPLPAVNEPKDWPLEAAVWLYKAGISNADIAELGFYWNPHLQRVVLPVRDESGELIYWQARTLDKANARKYLNPRVDKRRLIAKFGEGACIVLTEDLLSAIKVSRAGVAGWSLLGTKINDFIAAEIVRSGKPVAVWLDPDAAGQENATQIIKKLRAYGVRVRNVLSDKDPKLLQRTEIERLLE